MAVNGKPGPVPVEPIVPALPPGLRGGNAAAVAGTDALAVGVWRLHQADRAWIEWGWCWPPLSVARPRCRSCAAAWRCQLALAAHDHLSRHGLCTPPGGLQSPVRAAW